MLKKIIKHLKQGTLLQTISVALRNKPKVYYHNITNKVKYGSSAPRKNETIWTKANEVDKLIPDALL